jgi:hypothetical protein
VGSIVNKQMSAVVIVLFIGVSVLSFLIANVVNYFVYIGYRHTFCVYCGSLWRYLRFAMNKLLFIRLLLLIFA